MVKKKKGGGKCLPKERELYKIVSVKTKLDNCVCSGGGREIEIKIERVSGRIVGGCYLMKSVIWFSGFARQEGTTFFDENRNWDRLAQQPCRKWT